MTELLDGQVSMFDLDLPSGKTFPEPSAATKEKTSRPSSKPSQTSAKKEGFQFLNLSDGNGNLTGAYWEITGALPGESTTPVKWEDTAFPSEENVSTLSQILQLDAPEKYCLSATACAGIVRRAEKRGKQLPDMLRDALMEVITHVGGTADEEPEDETKSELDDE